MDVLRLDPAPDTADGHVLVFLPGFLSSASSYRMLLEPLTAHGISVVVPQLYRRGPAVLAGRYTVEHEAHAAAAVVRGEAGGRRDRTVVLGGHSRGGQAAWRAANLLAGEGLPAALVLVDPVDGAGRRPEAPSSSLDPVEFQFTGGRSAPCGRGRRRDRPPRRTRGRRGAPRRRRAR